MPIDNLSKITSRSGINTTILLEAGNANVTGIVTAAGFDGPFTGGSGSDINAGIVTAANGLHVGAGGTIIHALSEDRGKVGIGNTNPYYNLHINFNNSTTAFSGGTSGNWGGAGIRIENDSTTVGAMALAHFRVYDADWHIGNKYVGNNDSDFVFNHEGSEKVRIDSDGKVGIGSAVPTAKLEVRGSGSSNTLNFLTKDVNRNTVFYAKDGGQVGIHYYPLVINQDTTDTATPSGTYFYVHHSSNPFIIKSDGKVGVGITNPNNALDVQGGSTNTAIVARSTDAKAQVSLVDNLTTSVGCVVLGAERDDLFLTSGSGGGERLRIASDGKIFFGNHAGTISTTAHLGEGNTFQLAGLSSNDGISVVRFNSSYGTYGLNIGRSKSNTLGTNVALQDNNEIGHITYWGADGSDYNMAAQISAEIDGTPSDGADMPGALTFKTSSESSGTPTERLRITSGGLVKINEANPVASTNGENALLQVKSVSQYDGLLLGHGYEYGTIGRGAAGALIYTGNASPGNLGGTEKIMHDWWSGSAGGGGPNRLMVLTTSGNLGIGTSIPGAQLHLNGATPGVRITDTDTSGPIHTNIDGASGYLTVDVGSVHRDVIITSVDQANEIVRFTGDGSVNIGGSEQTDHMLYLTSTGDASIHIRADSSNTTGAGENYNPSLSMSQDGSNAQLFKLGMVGEAGQEFAQSIANASFIHANNANSQPLQLAHMDNLALTISNVESSHFHSTSGNSTGGLKIANRGNDTAASLLLQGHNNTGTPGQATNTQLTHLGANLEFEIKHNGDRAIHVGNTRRIRLPGVPGVAGSGLVNVSIESDGNLCTTTSLREYKTNITSISDTSWLYNLNPVTFNWKKKTEVDGENVWEDTPDGNGTQYGLIAEEVEVVKKEFCYYDNDNKLSGVHYERLIAPLIKALQEQKTEIDSLKTKVSALEGS